MRPLFVGTRPVGAMRAPASRTASNNERLSSSSGSTNRGSRASRSGIAFRTPVEMLFNAFSCGYRVAVVVGAIFGIPELLLASFPISAPVGR